MKGKFKKQQKTKAIQVYIPQIEKIKEMQKKYKVSISHIATTTAENLLDLYGKTKAEDLIKMNENYYKENISEYKHTTIKPKYINQNYLPKEEKANVFFTNILHYYATKFSDCEFLTKEEQNKLMQKINSKLNQEREAYWDLNEQIRKQKRVMEKLGVKKQ